MSNREERAGSTATLRRTLSLWQVALSGVGVILGAGVYALIAPAVREAGSALWAAFLLAALTAGLTAYTYARLAAVGSVVVSDPAWLDGPSRATATNADLLVIGARATTGVRRALLGSVASGAVDRSRVPVLVVR